MKRLFIILIIIILLCIYLYKPFDYSEFLTDYNEDIVGNIIINTNEYDLLQGLDNEYYLTHDNNKNYDSNGSIFIGYETDLNRHQTNELFIPVNIIINDEISINYLDNNINYKIVEKTNKKDKLIINIYDNNKIVKKIDAIRI